MKKTEAEITDCIRGAISDYLQNQKLWTGMPHEEGHMNYFTTYERPTSQKNLSVLCSCHHPKITFTNKPLKGRLLFTPIHDFSTAFPA